MNTDIDTLDIEQAVKRTSSFYSHPVVLTDIYKEEVNLAVWQTSFSDALSHEIADVVNNNKHLKAVMTVTPDNVVKALQEDNQTLENANLICQHIATLVDMFCTLFELKRVGLRLNIIDKAMCPRFHVDRVPCRLVTTLYGAASQWLAHDSVDRSKLGAGNEGKSDELSGLIQSNGAIKQLATADVALLKGESWYNNENAGLVHRSPPHQANTRRLVMTLDFID